MNRKIHILSIFALLFVSFLWGEVREVTIFHTTDTHATGKWPKLATLIRQQKMAHPQSLLIDCGDTIQGSIPASISRGEAGLQGILCLPYDVWVPGNHEANFGMERFGEIMTMAGDKLLCANFSVKGFPQPRAWRILECNGLRLAVIGGEASFFKHWVLPSEFKKCRVEKLQTSLKRILPEVLKEKPDGIILVTHQAWIEGADPRGVNEINEIAKFYPEIDLILGAHTHREIPGRKIGLRAWYCQAGCLGNALGVVHFKADNKTHKVVEITSELLPVSDSLPDDPQLMQCLAPFFEQTQRYLSEDLGIELDKKIIGGRLPGQGNAMSDLFCQAIAKASGAEIALHGQLSKAELPAGKIYRAHLHAVIPYENTIITAEVTADELTAIMQEQWDQKKSYRFNGPWNARFLIGSKLRFLGTGENTPPEKRRYKIAIHSHAAAGSGTCPILRYILERPTSKTTDTGISTRKALEEFLKHNKPAPTRAWLLKR